MFYTWGEEVLKDKYDPGFGKIITWDIPLLEGYEYEFVKNIVKTLALMQKIISSRIYKVLGKEF